MLALAFAVSPSINNKTILFSTRRRERESKLTVHPEKARLRDERRERERCKVDVLLAVFGEQCGERGFFYEGVSVHIIKGERFDLPVVNSIVVPR